MDTIRSNEPFIAQRADPYIYRHTDGTYYFTASVPTYDRIILRRADSLSGLRDAEETVVWKKHERGEMSEHIWAPELHYLSGKWYLYFAAGEKEDVWRIRPFVLECTGQDPVKDAWIEKGKMQRAEDDIYSFEAFSLDATVFEHRGAWYFVWAEKVSVGIQISNLYIARMESPTKLATAQVLLTTPDYDWERQDIWVNEGPAVLHGHDEHRRGRGSSGSQGVEKGETARVKERCGQGNLRPRAQQLHRFAGRYGSVRISCKTLRQNRGQSSLRSQPAHPHHEAYL